MKQLAIIRFFSIIVGGISLFMLPPLAMAFALNESSMFKAFLIPIAIGLVLALSAIFFIPKTPLSIRPRDGFLLVFMVWALAIIMSAFCYYFSPAKISLIDAIFEAASGITTTGATTISDVDSLPRSLVFWRSVSVWAGGMGIILLSVALLPLLGVGGFQLIKAEVPGPEKERIKPRIAETAKVLWAIYFIFTLILIFLYRFGGMDWFDAVCYGLAVISTGGVNVRNEGFAYYNSAFIDWVTVAFMLFAAINFSLYYRIAHGKYQDFLHNTEIKAFLSIFAVAAVVAGINIYPLYNSFGEALRLGSFQAASILTTAGITRTDFCAWPVLTQCVLFSLMFIGGCSGSTAGGIKVIRFVVLFKQIANELRKTLHPNGVFSIQLNRKVGRKDVVYGVAGFVSIYLLIVCFSAFLTANAGIADVFSSFYTSLAIMSNTGVSLNDLCFGDLPNYLKLYYSILMIVGRLEIWTVIVLFTPNYWRR